MCKASKGVTPSHRRQFFLPSCQIFPHYKIKCGFDSNLSSIVTMGRISLLLLMLATANAQRCCVFTALQDAIQNPSQFSDASMPQPPLVAPDQLCSGLYSWRTCISGCTTISCLYQNPGKGAPTKLYFGMCDPYQQYTAESLQMRSERESNVTCSQSLGIIEQVVPLTSSTVSSSAAAGSVGGSILGALIAAILSWFLNNFGEIILKFLLGTVYTKTHARFKRWYDSRKKAADAVAGSNDDVETGAHGRELSAAATILNVTPTEPATISGVAGASNQNPVKAVKVN